MGNVNWVILGFRSEKCTQFFFGPRTSDFRPDYRNPYIKGTTNEFFICCLRSVRPFFQYFWPLALPNIAEIQKGAAIVEKTSRRVWKGFGKGLEELGSLFWKLNLETVITSAASAASRELGERPADGSASGWRGSGRSPSCQGGCASS